VVSAQAFAAAFGVSPIRLDLDRAARTGAITISNDDTTKLSFQMKLRRWTQDESGVDRYEDSSDLVYFPRLATIDPKDKRVVRVGTQNEGLGATEKTYRLFIEEVPDASVAPVPGAAVAVRMRFALPIFVAPAAPEVRAEALEASLQKGEIRIPVKNLGNQHVKIDTVTVTSEGKTVKELAGWYVLAGATRAFAVPLTRQECAAHPRVEVLLKGEKLQLRRELALDPARCGP
jgi:fimbrial chaperone protein